MVTRCRCIRIIGSALLAVVIFVAGSAGARSDVAGAATAGPEGLSRDGGARQFTLLHRIVEVAALGVMPNGDVLVAMKEAAGSERAGLWRLGLDGRYELIGRLPSMAKDLVAETPATILFVPYGTRRIERYDLMTGTSTVVADLSSPIRTHELKQLVVLDDASIVVTDGFFAWRVRPDGVKRVLPGKESAESIRSLAALPGGAFAYVDVNRDAVIRVGADGRRRTLLRRRELGGGLNTLLASAGAQLIVLRLIDSGDQTRAQLVTISAGRVREVITERIDPPVYGNGDGYGPSGLTVAPNDALLASDGSLLMRQPSDDGPMLRALVPRASPRLRIALRPSIWRAFARGRVDYIASAAGELELSIRTAGGRTVTEQRASTRAGAGTLRLRQDLPRGRYDVRLTLTTPNGARTRAKARIFTSTTLTLRAARTALRRSFHESEGDGADAAGSEIGDRCVRRSQRRVDCRLVEYETTPDGSTRGTCRGWTVAILRPDGIRTSTDNLDCSNVLP